MRDYARIAPTFWTGKTGRAIRAMGPEAVIVALYLMTSPHSNMLGLYYQPTLYMAHETGLGIEGASKGLAGCIEAEFCAFDEASEMVWVFEMAAYQIASELKADDKRCKGIQKDYAALPDCPFLGAFFDRYSTAFHLSARRDIKGAWQGSSEPHRSKEKEKEKEKDLQEANASSSPAKLPTTPIAKLIELYHEQLPELPRVRLETKDRTRALRKTWEWVLTSKRPDGSPRASTADEALEWFRDYFGRAGKNDFLMGRTQRSGEHANWRCDIDFLLTDRGMKQVIEKTEVAA